MCAHLSKIIVIKHHQFIMDKLGYHGYHSKPATKAVGDLGSNETTFHYTMLW
jgi:hypothetical protein